MNKEVLVALTAAMTKEVLVALTVAIMHF